MLKRIAVLAVALIGLTAAPVAAGEPPQGDPNDPDVFPEYPPEDKASISDTTPCPGGAATVTGEFFEPGGEVVVTLDDTTELGRPTADDEGRISLDITIPTTTATGSHKVTATGPQGDGGELKLNVDINVVPCEAGPPTTARRPGSALPRTGSDSTMTLVRAGVALAALGGVLLAVAAKRRRRTALA